MNKQERLIKYLQRHKNITSLEAVEKLGDTRISATIFELRNKGYNIETIYIRVSNRFDEKCRIGVYCLDKDKESTIKKYKKSIIK